MLIDNIIGNLKAKGVILCVQEVLLIYLVTLLNGPRLLGHTVAGPACLHISCVRLSYCCVWHDLNLLYVQEVLTQLIQ